MGLCTLLLLLLQPVAVAVALQGFCTILPTCCWCAAEFRVASACRLLFCAKCRMPLLHLSLGTVAVLFAACTCARSMSSFCTCLAHALAGVVLDVM